MRASPQGWWAMTSGQSTSRASQWKDYEENYSQTKEKHKAIQLEKMK